MRIRSDILAFTKFAAIAACLHLFMLSPSQAGPTAWVSNEKDNTVTVIDIETLEAVETIEVGQRPRGVIFSKDFSNFSISALQMTTRSR